MDLQEIKTAVNAGNFVIAKLTLHYKKATAEIVDTQGNLLESHDFDLPADLSPAANSELLNRYRGEMVLMGTKYTEAGTIFIVNPYN